MTLKKRPKPQTQQPTRVAPKSKTKKHRENDYLVDEYGDREYIINHNNRVYFLHVLNLRTNVHNIIMVEILPENLDRDFFIFHRELYNSIMFDSREHGVDDALDQIVDNIERSFVDLDDPVDIAITFGGTVLHRKPISISKFQKRDLH